MNDNELFHYRVEQVEERVNRIEKFILSGILSIAGLGVTILWLVLDLPNKMQPQNYRYETKKEP